MKMVGCNLRRHCIAINVRVRPIIDKSLSYTEVQLLNSIKQGDGVAPGPGYLVTKCDECDAPNPSCRPWHGRVVRNVVATLHPAACSPHKEATFGNSTTKKAPEGAF